MYSIQYTVYTIQIMAEFAVYRIHAGFEWKRMEMIVRRW